MVDLVGVRKSLKSGSASLLVQSNDVVFYGSNYSSDYLIDVEKGN